MIETIGITAEITISPTRSHLRCSCDIQLQRCIRCHDGTDVAALDDNATVGDQFALNRHQPLTHLRHPRNGTHACGHLRTANLSADIATIYTDDHRVGITGY